MSFCCIVLLFILGIVGQSVAEEVECEPGQFLHPELKECQECRQGTFSSTRNRAAYCSDCRKSCFDPRNALVLHDCNSTHDLICQCKDGYYASSMRSLCRKHTKCAENCLKYPGSATSNTECLKPCPAITSSTNLLVKNSTGSTASTVNFTSTDALSVPLDETTSSSNKTASNTFVQIGLPVLVIVVVVLIIVLIIYCWMNRPKLQRAFKRNMYQNIQLNGGNQHLPVDAPPQLPPRNGDLAGNGHFRTHQQIDEHDQRTELTFESEVPSVGNAELSSQESPEPLHNETLLLDSRQREALVHVPNSHILPLEQRNGEVSSPEAEALLNESQRENSLSRQSLPPEAVLPEMTYGLAHLLLDSADAQDSPAGFSSESLPTSPSEDLQGARPRTGPQHLHRLSTRPCARVQPQVLLQPELNREANIPQHTQGNYPQHIQLNHQPNYQPNHQPNYQPNHQPNYQPNHQPNYQPNHQPEYQPHLQPNYPPGVPGPIVNVENVYSINSLGESLEVS